MSDCDVSQAACAGDYESEQQQEQYEICALCGAVSHGNISCPTCRDHMLFLSKKTRMALAHCEIMMPMGTKSDSVFVKNIKSANDNAEF